MGGMVFPDGSAAKNQLAMQDSQETLVWSLGREDPLEVEMETHLSIFAWKIPRTEEPIRLQRIGSQRVGHDWLSNNDNEWNNSSFVGFFFLFFFFCGWLISLSTVSSRFIHVVAYDRISYFLRLNNILLYVHATFCLSIYPSIDFWVAPTSWLLWIV